MTMAEGWLRTKRGDDGSMEIWARGWRLEQRALPLLPLVIAGGFLMASAPLPIRVVGSAALLGVAFACWRLTRMGLRLTADAITIANIRRSVRVPWEDFIGFVGERSGEDGRCVLVLKSGDQVAISGRLDGEELNPYGEEGDLSAIDELNMVVARYRRELTRGDAVAIPPASPGARRLSAAG